MTGDTNSDQTEPVRPRRGAVGVIYQDRRFLVIRRSALVAAPLKYCFPGGTIESGETEEQALVRELDEELGVRATPIRRVWASVTPWKVELCWWQAQLTQHDRLAPNPAEVESVHWYSAEEMLALPELLDSNRAFLAAIARREIRLNDSTSE